MIQDVIFKHLNHDSLRGTRHDSVQAQSSRCSTLKVLINLSGRVKVYGRDSQATGKIQDHESHFENHILNHA